MYSFCCVGKKKKGIEKKEKICTLWNLNANRSLELRSCTLEYGGLYDE